MVIRVISKLCPLPSYTTRADDTDAAAVDVGELDGRSYNGGTTSSRSNVVGDRRSVCRLVAALPHRQPLPQLHQRQRPRLTDGALSGATGRPLAERTEPSRLLHHEHHLQTHHDVISRMTSLQTHHDVSTSLSSSESQHPS